MKVVVLILVATFVVGFAAVQIADVMRPKTVLVRFTNGPTVIGTVVVPVSQ